MSIEEAFSAYIDGLTTDEREALGACLVMVPLAVSLADDDLTLREIFATGRGMGDGQQVFGPGFTTLIEHGRVGMKRFDADKQRELLELKQRLAAGPSAAELEVLATRASAMDTGLKVALPVVAQARPLLDRMDASLREAFDAYLVKLIVAVAEASGGFLWWGEKISQAEREGAQTLLGALGLTVSDAEARKKLGLGAA